MVDSPACVLWLSCADALDSSGNRRSDVNVAIMQRRVSARARTEGITNDEMEKHAMRNS
jgi:hypothetical protein